MASMVYYFAMNIHLIIHNIGFIISAGAALGIFFFFVLNKERTTASITFGLLTLCVAIWIIAHVIGVSVSDPVLSRNILMLNLVMIGFAAPLNVHSVLAFLGKARERWYMLAIIYAAGIFMTVWFAWHPDLFLLPSVPKMYFPNYYNPGILNWTRMAFFFGVCMVYMLVELFIGYIHEAEAKKKQQMKYLIIAIIIGYAVGNMPNFLVYNIPIDPFWGTLFVALFAVPFIYGIIKYELFDIRVIAKKAFVYSISIAAVGGLIILFDYSNRLIESVYPNFPVWITPLISAILVVLVAGFVWRTLREGDLLKYEFITTVTHKFRTPLTHIKWASENLSKGSLSADGKTQVEYIKTADEKLVELTGLLMNVSETENSNYEYHLARGDISRFLNEIAEGYREHYAIKKITETSDIQPGLYAEFDESRIKFVLQTLLENAINYTSEGGTVSISMKMSGSDIVCSVKDSGIGIPKDELPRLFSKFYRGSGAKLADTEGMGIGLYISRQIMARHRGKIWAESEGPGKGSTFSFSLPMAG